MQHWDNNTVFYHEVEMDYNGFILLSNQGQSSKKFLLSEIYLSEKYFKSSDNNNQIKK